MSQISQIKLPDFSYTSAQYSLAVRNASAASVASPTASDIFAGSYADDSRVLALVTTAGTVKLFDCVSDDKQPSGELRDAPPLDASQPVLPLTSVAFRSHASVSAVRHVLVTGGADGSVCHWHADTQTKLSTVTEANNQVLGVDCSPDGTQFASCGSDFQVRLYDEATKTRLKSFGDRSEGSSGKGHTNRVYAVKFAPKASAATGATLVSGGWDNTVLVWDTRTGAAERVIFGPHICGAAVDFSPDGSQLVTASWKPAQALQVWDLASGRLISTVDWDGGGSESVTNTQATQMLYAASYSADGKYIAAGGGSGDARIFHAGTFELLDVQHLPVETAPIYCVKFSPNSQRLAIAGAAPSFTQLTFC